MQFIKACTTVLSNGLRGSSSKSSTFTGLINLRDMKYKSSVRRLCEYCSIVRRGKYLHVICKFNPRHKQKQKS